MSDRRYSEREIREVFERAAREQEQATRHAEQDGLTLAEMQDVAASAGIAPGFVASAARSVALGEPEQGRLMMGPISRGVFRTEFLPTPPTDALWNDLVADLRRTFSAQGKVTEGGRVREWRNGNLRVTLEPAGDGSRLHLRTRRDNAAPLATIATAVAIVGLFTALLVSLNVSADPEALTRGLMMVLGGTLGAAGVWTQQRTWAATRERQMEAVAERTVAQSRDETAERAVGTGEPGRIDPSLLNLDAPGIPQPDDRRRTRS